MHFHKQQHNIFYVCLSSRSLQDAILNDYDLAWAPPVVSKNISTSNAELRTRSPEARKAEFCYTLNIITIICKYTIIAEIYVFENKTKSLDKERADGRFRDRLKLDVQSVSLIITHIRITDSGLYHITIRGQEKPLKRFNITVYTRLPVPVITRDSLQNSSSSLESNCSVLCSVMNVSHVSLSWYKGKSLLSNISVSEHSNINISLHLECLDDSYGCVLNNPITNQTQHLNTEDCHKCSGTSAVYSRIHT
ncbi:uncharacterized protein LOC130429856 [Triplophysa dalaica]|uniref:uncharacterized protein LOC130429856 n=1 Tax=Triplophysa dalaica TaxID=1582913 RepID=UPI0024DF9BCC|nr:uncharacterized protein LOC130429856 [Triplophysa dalaica]